MSLFGVGLGLGGEGELQVGVVGHISSSLGNVGEDSSVGGVGLVGGP
jgi:hypothetical protein